MQHQHFASVTSTNDVALAAALRAPTEVVLISADEQTAGRGRQGRTWRSPRGGAWFTLAWPGRHPPAHYQPVPLLAGLAVVHALDALLPAPPAGLPPALQIKWPNDVLLHGCKVAGILCEQTLLAQPAQVTLIVGIGINANLTPQDLGSTSDLRYPAATLQAALGRPVDVPALIQAVAQRLEQHLQTLETHSLPADTLAQIHSRLAWRDQTITLQRGSQSLTGICRGIDAQGRLLLEEPTGTIALESGEVQNAHAHT